MIWNRRHDRSRAETGAAQAIPVGSCAPGTSRNRDLRATAVILLIVGALGGSRQAIGDEMLAGAEKHRRVEIVGFSGGVVAFRTQAGAVEQLAVTGIDYIIADGAAGLEDFNEAETYLLKEQPAQAVVWYTQALRSADGFWRELIRARLLIAADRGGMVPQAVLTFLYLVRDDAATAAHLLPRSTPTEQGESAQRLLDRVERALQESRDSESRIVIELLRYRLLRSMFPSRADALASVIATRPLPARLGTMRTFAVKLDAIEVLVRAGTPAAAAMAVDAILGAVPDALMPRVLLLKARALHASVGTSGDFRPALPAMRVVVHYPDSPEAADALLLVAMVHEQAGLAADAVGLVRECLAKEGLSQHDAGQARRMLTRLTRSKPR